MSYIGKNIRKIRGVKSLNQSQFAELFDISRASVGAYEEGRAEPKISTILEIANHFGISIDLLLKKELTVNELYRFDIFHDQLHGSGKTAESTNYSGSVSVVVPAFYKDYIKRLADESFLASLPSMPTHAAIIRGERLFEMDGPAMSRENGGIHEGDLLICELVEPTKWEQFTDGLVYVVVTDVLVLARRAYRQGKTIELKADHPDIEPTKVTLSKVKEIWKVNGTISYELPIPTGIEDRVARLEQLVAELQNNR